MRKLISTFIGHLRFVNAILMVCYGLYQLAILNITSSGKEVCGTRRNEVVDLYLPE
jgi:hypothetical protein